ncbi:hypothetical protein CYLTODRAFT_423753 [Cylindrobasidium torrendii FP15055 ss-10]|uniref:Uncharacterized protein n=1 Tax=Cylindrobasidium torrendii FP15055 ss-10 TaxID=1314674 RepID=A0A0D7B691_9AGAR|nr:hypothetical protein CYLTODRAFT_423753 [Cylindrobasidium torrendii FP15055 ss-10]
MVRRPCVCMHRPLGEGIVRAAYRWSAVGPQQGHEDEEDAFVRDFLSRDAMNVSYKCWVTAGRWTPW